MENLFLLRANKQQTKSIMTKGRTREEIMAMYNRHIETVYRVCFSLMGNKSDAEDVTQAVFLELMKNNIQFLDTEHEKAWLITVARNQCRDTHRQWWRKKVVALNQTVETISIDTYEIDPVMDTLMQLPSKLRIVLYLHYYEGYKLSEIAGMLELNINTVKTQIRTAKQQLKFELGDDFND
jgi:RNA polymerase sigma-70 factor (ECF subfamily)